jgi:hypothetical protein
VVIARKAAIKIFLYILAKFEIEVTTYQFYLYYC